MTSIKQNKRDLAEAMRRVIENCNSENLYNLAVCGSFAMKQGSGLVYSEVKEVSEQVFNEADII